MAADDVGIHRLEPGPGDQTGLVSCAICGKTWTTSAEQDELLAEVFDHWDTHRPVTGAGPSSADPPISTR